MSSRNAVVLVTGGCGFLGSHLVRLLAEKAEEVSIIRVVDLQPKPSNFLNEVNNVKIEYTQADITNYEALGPAFRDVLVVFHVASSMDTSMMPDSTRLNRVNVEGTKNVINQCIENNVVFLIHTSSTEINHDDRPRHNCTEEDIDPKSYIMAGYPLSKFESETSVLAANNSSLRDGGNLKTIVMRPTAIYGEGDRHYITPFLRTAKACGGILLRIGSPDVKMSRTYVGNVAWAQICAMNALLEDKDVAGRSYIITDDTPPSNNFLWTKPFIEALHMKLLPFSIPLAVLYYLVAIVEFFIWMISPFWEVKVMAGKSGVKLCCSSATYDGSKARRELEYTPLFSAEQAFNRSYQFYSNPSTIL